MPRGNPNWREESRVTIIGPNGQEVIVGSTKLAAQGNTMHLTVTGDSGATMTIVLGAEVVKSIGHLGDFHGVRPSPYVDLDDAGNVLDAPGATVALPPPGDEQ